MNRSATDRLKQLVATAVASEELTQEELAREARLPGKVFRSLLRNGHRPTIDRADELCKALGITMTIGATPNPFREQIGTRLVRAATATNVNH